MNFLELVTKRYSVRTYKPAPVERGTIDRCIQAARLAPSACNSQPWHFVVVDDPGLKDKLAREAFEGLLTFNHFVLQSPVLILLVSERQKLSAKFGSLVKRKNFSQMDIGMAAEHFCLQATEEGLGTCMLGWFNETKVKRLFSIPKARRIELIISAGFAAEATVPAKKRKPVDTVVSYNRYS